VGEGPCALLATTKHKIPRVGSRAEENARFADDRPAIAEKNDYSKPDTWLCRPGRQDACAVDLATTVIAADGKMTHDDWAADPKAGIDCFYIYPTVSNDPGGNSDMTQSPEEKAVIRAQFARFASKCRFYAPMYRRVPNPFAEAGLWFFQLQGNGGRLNSASALRLAT
jgi:hypothetical protein